jgi:hypothetical protein
MDSFEIMNETIGTHDSSILNNRFECPSYAALSF